jgi:hypothetical protein
MAALAGRGQARRRGHEEYRLAENKLRDLFVQFGINLHDVLLRALSAPAEPAAHSGRAV